MRQTILMSLAVSAALHAADTEEKWLSGTLSKQLRVAYINQNNAIDQDTYATAFGAIVKYETPTWNNISLGAAVYVSRKLNFATGSVAQGTANGDMFGRETDSYIYLGEAYVDYTTDVFSLRIGRQQIDTPLADTDDIRMHPNTFEAAIATYTPVDGTTIVGGYVRRWAGYDSGDDISKFKRLDGAQSDGAFVAGIMNESIENLALQGWYYGIDRLANAVYADATYVIPFTETAELELLGQFATFDEKNGSGIDGHVYGFGASLGLGMATFGAAYNKSSNSEGQFASNGFGGGPYVTSMEEMTIDGYQDVRAYQLSAGLDFEKAGVEGATLSVLYGDFKSTPAQMRVKEIDLIATYELSEALNAEVSYAMVEDRNNNTSADGLYDGGYDRFLVRLTYRF
ncbi:MAG: OprD family outer membrane porin [Sulfuricurvum sp.]